MKKNLVFFLLISQIIFAQNTIDFESEDYYYLKKSEHVKISLEKGKLSFTNAVYEQATYNTGNKLFFANEFIPFSDFRKIRDLEASTYLPKENKTLKVAHFEVKDEVGGITFYSDQKSMNFVFPAVSKDAITTLTYFEEVNEPYFMYSLFAFGSGVPTKEMSYSYEVPKDVELGYKTFNLDNTSVLFEKKETKKTTIYTWKATNIDKYESSKNSLPAIKYIPHIIVYIKNYSVGKVKTAVLNDVSDLYSWYTTLTKQVDRSNLESVFTIAENLVKNLYSDPEKAKAIFNWVQSNISYIAVGDGYNGFIADGASSVFTKRYGDCKGMTNILYEMLNHVNIKTHHTWIGSRKKPFSYYDVPTPIVDDHMIATIIIDKKKIFLDATDAYVPFGMPSSFIQGKEALIGVSDTEFEIVKVPEQAKEKNISTIETTVTLDENTIKASEKRTFTGYRMVDFIGDVKRNKNDKTEEEYLNHKYKIGNNKTSYLNINLGDLSAKDSYSITYDLEINNYVKKIGSKIYLNLNLEKPLSNDIILIKKQRFGKKIDHKYIKNYITTFVIPEGYKLKSIPKNSSNELELYGYSFTFKQKNNKLVVNKRIYMNTLALESEQFEDYNIFIKSLIKAYKKSIVLEKI
ncbi:MAG: DUF3857 domain-containing protein [Flavobacteriaceae bacterium]|nr:DUF3857 domain-containing protein [Flavobacteriaceae bacterium]